MINTAMMVGFAAGFAAMLSLLVKLVPRLQAVTSALELGAVMCVFGATVLAIGIAVYLLSLSAMVLITRGKKAIAFVPPSRCRSFQAWLGSSWRFFSNGGKQEGIRAFGLEIAVQGTLE